MRCRNDNFGTQRASSSLRSGTAATEFAIIAPFLPLTCIACVDLGRASHDYIALSNSARVGAEYGATHQFTPFTRSLWEARLREATSEELQSITGYLTGAATVLVNTASQPDGLSIVTVEATYPFEPVVNWPGLPQPIILHRTVAMRQYR